MPDMEPVYEALRSADAAGRTEDVQKLSEYIRSQPSPSEQPKQVQQPETKKSYLDQGVSAVKNFINNKDGPKAERTKTPISDIAKSTLTGGAIGGGIAAAAVAFAPEIMQVAGVAATGLGAFFPPLLAVGPPLIEAGTALKVARLGTAIGSTLLASAGSIGLATATAAGSSAVGKTAGIAAANQGVSQRKADLIEVGATAGTTLIPGIVKGVIGAMLPGAAKTALNVFNHFSEGKSVESAQKALSSLTEKGVPEQFAMKQLKKGMADAEMVATKTRDEAIKKGMQDAIEISGRSPVEAAKHVKEITAAGNQLVADTKTQSLVIQDALGNKLNNVSRFDAFAKPELNKLAAPKEMTDIGNDLRASVSKEQQQLSAARHEAYGREHTELSDIAKGKEEAGIFPTDSNTNKKFTDGLEAKLLNTKEGIAAAKGRDVIGDPSIRAANQQLYEALTPRKLETGEIVKPTFESLRQTSRKLGEKAYGSVDTGFSALSQKEAQVAKEHIDTLLNEHVGDRYEAMQKKYSVESGELSKYNSKTGKAATAIDRMDTEAFVTDAQSLPGKYFKTSTGVKDLIELTGGDKEKVLQLAKDYSRHELEDMSSKDAYAFIAKGSDWIRELPGLKQELTATADSLKAIESNLSKAGNVLKSSQTTAKETFDAAQKSSQIFNKDGFDTATIQQLLKSNDQPAIKKALDTVAGTPGGKEQLVGLARNVLSTQNKKTVTETWQNLGPIVKRLISPTEYEKIAIDVKVLEKAGDTTETRSKLRRLTEKALLSITNQFIGSVTSENTTN